MSPHRHGTGGPRDGTSGALCATTSPLSASSPVLPPDSRLLDPVAKLVTPTRFFKGLSASRVQNQPPHVPWSSLWKLHLSRFPGTSSQRHPLFLDHPRHARIDQEAWTILLSTLVQIPPHRPQSHLHCLLAPPPPPDVCCLSAPCPPPGYSQHSSQRDSFKMEVTSCQPCRYPAPGILHYLPHVVLKHRRLSTLDTAPCANAVPTPSSHLLFPRNACSSLTTQCP